MLTMSHITRIYLCARATDMRNGADGLSGLVQSYMGQDPLLCGESICFQELPREQAEGSLLGSNRLCHLV